MAQLRAEPTPAERERLTLRVESAVAPINGLFDGLLDISKLDAGVVAAEVSDFPLQQVLDRVEATLAEEARARGLHLHVRPNAAWERSDPVLLERILDNLVANAPWRRSFGGGGLAVDEAAVIDAATAGRDLLCADRSYRRRRPAAVRQG